MQAQQLHVVNQWNRMEQECLFDMAVDGFVQMIHAPLQVLHAQVLNNIMHPLYPTTVIFCKGFVPRPN